MSEPPGYNASIDEHKQPVRPDALLHRMSSLYIINYIFLHTGVSQYALFKLIILLIINSGRIFEGTTTPDQDEIAEYERLLKTVPQLQLIADEGVSNSQFDCFFLNSLFI